MTPAEFEQEAAFLAELEDWLREKGDDQGLILAIKAHANLQLMLTENKRKRLAVRDLALENERLRAALENIAGHQGPYEYARRIAHDALHAT